MLGPICLKPSDISVCEVCGAVGLWADCVHAVPTDLTWAGGVEPSGWQLLETKPSSYFVCIPRFPLLLLWVLRLHTLGHTAPVWLWCSSLVVVLTRDHSLVVSTCTWLTQQARDFLAVVPMKGSAKGITCSLWRRRLTHFIPRPFNYFSPGWRGNTWRCPGIISGSVICGHSWWGTRAHMECCRSNSSWPHAG